MGRFFLSFIVIFTVVLVLVAIGVVLFRISGLRLNQENKPGATLLVVLIVIFFVAVAALFLMGPPPLVIRNAEKKKTETILSVIRMGLELEIANTGRFPASVELATFKSSSAASELQSLKAVSTEPPGLLDGWGQPILIEQPESGRFRLTSFGGDLKAGTRDDLVVEWPEPVPGPKSTTTKPTNTPAPMQDDQH